MDGRREKERPESKNREREIDIPNNGNEMERTSFHSVNLLERSFL